MQITRPETTSSTDRNVQQYLTFMIAGEEYAVTLLKVREIIEYDTVTEVPRTPEWIRGVINLRGSVVPVIDLAVKLRQAPSVAGKLTCIVITEVECEGEATVMGIMADSVRQVIDLNPQDVEPPPTFGTRVKVDYLLGMARSGKKFCLILDTEKVLSTDELLELPDAIDQAAANLQPELALSETQVALETPETSEVSEPASLE
ncbi:MAG TPA: chemotaxis protein CheW [Candidatus Dormibacteraeota bacterium]|jgi:purine-binding chemotaxis protein CheW|nr:chemotaxis protein CheW [Candidatus Dormibacteraeota bacterium]